MYLCICILLVSILYTTLFGKSAAERKNKTENLNHRQCHVRAKWRPAYLTTLAYLLYYRLLNLSIWDSRSIFRYYVRDVSRCWPGAERACKSGR